MGMRYSPLLFLFFLAACDGHDNSASQQSPSTFTTPQSEVVSTTTPIAPPAVVVPPTTPSTEVVVSSTMTLDQALAVVRAGNAQQLIDAGLAAQFGQALAEAGNEPEAFALLAPPEYKAQDHNTYDTTGTGAIDPTLVDEKPSAMHHVLSIGGKDVSFTARTGHLIAYAPADPKNPDKKDAEVAVFYTAYTRDGLPKEKRPVTFFWNGGPGSASIWLHLGSWAPWRLKSDAPSIPEQFYYSQPESFPFEANAITLLDKSDLVFVDATGTGFSTAAAPHKNSDYWGTDSDGQLMSDFITRYNNVNNRQSSPKYLYGESYGGIRTPIVADLLEGAGTSRFDPDPSGKPPVVLTGFVLNSPLLDYTSNCDMANYTDSLVGGACASYLPSYAMAADFLHRSAPHNDGKSTADYHKSLEDYAINTYQATLLKYPDVTDASGANAWSTYTATKDGKAFLSDLAGKTGVNSAYWQEYPDFLPIYFRQTVLPGYWTGRYDARMVLPEDSYAADDYINLAFLNQSKTFFPDYTNYVYSGSSTYQVLNPDTINQWDWPHRGSVGELSPASTVDLQETITQNPQVKLLVLHGYEDVATPGFQTELDLKNVKLADRVPVKWFEGGHMIYNTEASRVPLKTELNNYYDDPSYSYVPPAAAAARVAASN